MSIRSLFIEVTFPAVLTLGSLALAVTTLASAVADTPPVEQDGVSSSSSIQNAGTQATGTQNTNSWARFPGADLQGYVADGQIPHSWTESDYSWTRDLGSRDVGSPIVVDGKVYFMVSRQSRQQIVLESLDLGTGKLRWSKSFSQVEHHLHKRNTYASTSPTADEKYVFVTWADPQHTFLKCFDHDGNEVWSRDFGPWQSQHGFGTSPRIFGDMVLLLNSQQGDQLKPGNEPGQSRLIAVSRSSGETIWESPLKTTRSCYGVPAIYEPQTTAQNSPSQQIIGANTGNGMFSVDPLNGKMLWNLNVFEMRCCSTPLIVGDLAIASSGSGGGGNHLVAVRIPSSSTEKPEQAYRIDRGAPYVPTPVIRGERMFMIDDKGIASCINVTTGEKIWRQRVGGNFGASPIVIGDKMLVISLSGTATVLRAGDEFQKLSSFDLGGPVGASPAFVGGNLLLRIGNKICCLGGGSI